jgi:hypothetical protein
MVFGELHLPQPLDIDRVGEWLTHLASESGEIRLVTETRADSTGVQYLLGAKAKETTRLGRLVRAAIPEAQFIHGRSARVRREPMEVAGRVRVRPTGLPLRTDAPEAITRAILSTLAVPLKTGEGLVVQMVLGASRRPRTVPDHVTDPVASLWTFLSQGPPQASAETRRRMKQRHGQAGFVTTLRVGAAGRTPERRRYLLLSLLGALAIAQSPGVRLDLRHESVDRLNQARLPWLWPLHLSVEEIASLLGWPYAEEDLPGLRPLHPRPLRAAAHVHRGPRVFARSAAPGDGRLLGISAQDQLFHTVAYGPNGSGKTTVLLHFIAADIAAGRPVVVLDPKRQLIDDVLARLPKHRIGDVVEINAAEPASVGFNPLDVIGRDPDVVVDGILAVFQAVFNDGWGPRTADIFSGALRTLARTSTPSHPATLVDLPRLLTNPAYRRPLVGKLQDDIALAGFWAWYESQSAAAQAAAIAPPLNKLRQFLLRPALTRMLGQPSGQFRVRDVFKRNKIVLVPLNEGLIGPGTASLLGSLIIADVWQAAQERADARHPTPAVVYVDEAPRFLNLPVSLADALAISRSLSVGWFLAAQFRGQFPPELRTAVDMNARSKIIFATEYDDARDSAKLAKGLTPEDFTALPRFHAYANLVARGLPSGWALVKTLPPSLATADPEQVRVAVRANYDATTPISKRAPRERPEQRPAERVGRKQRQRGRP